MTKDEQLDEMNRTAQEIVRRLAAERGLLVNGDALGGVRFTGWKPRHDLFQGGNTVFWDEGLVGQWLDWRNPDKFYYMSVPSFKGGIYNKGETLNCGTERVALGQVEGIEQILVDGLDKLLALSA